MINSLTLTNWRTHKETKLVFDKGTNLITGVMGSGKSSIVNAISYSLFGTFPQLKTRSVALEEIIMNKPNPQNQAKTELVFSVNEKQYTVERVINKEKTNEAKLFEGSVLIAGPKQKDVNEKVEELLGISYELFSRAVYAEQNEIDFFLKLTPSDRKKKFDELLELDKYELVKKNSSTIENDFVKEKKQLEELINQQQENIKSQGEEELRKNILGEEKNINSLTVEENEFKKKLEEINKQYLIEKEKEKEHSFLQKENIMLIERINSLKEFLKKHEELIEEKILKEIIELKKEEEKELIETNLLEKKIKKQLEKEKENKILKENIIKIEQKIEYLKKETKMDKGFEEIEKKLIQTNNNITNLVKEKEETEKEKELIQNNLKKISEELNLIKHNFGRISKERTEVQSIAGKCPKCKQKMSEEHKTKILEEHNQEEKKLNEKLKELNKNKAEWSEKEKNNNEKMKTINENYVKEEKEKTFLEGEKKRVEVLKEKEKERKELEKELPLLKEKINLINLNEKELEENKNKKNSIEKKLIEIKNNLKTKTREKELAVEKKEKEKNLGEKEKKLINNKEALKKNSFDKNKFVLLQEEVYSTRNKHELVIEKINSKKEIKKNLENNLIKIELMKKKIEEYSTKKQHLLNVIEKVSVFSNCLIATQLELRENLLDTINQAMSEVWEEIYPYKDYINARLSVVQNGYDLQVLNRNNEWVRVEGILSGGERSAAAICIRISFALVLTKKLSILILDEPTHNLDSNAVTKLSEMLKHKLPKLVEQIFVITHEENFQQAATSSIYLLNRDKDSDEATKVETIQIN